MNASPVRVLVPAGMLGAGFTAASIDRGIALGADVIAIDGGSTDSGPAYLATAFAKMPAEAIAADLRLMLTSGAAARIPVIARAENLRLRMACIYSEQTMDAVGAALADGKVSPLAPAGPLGLEVLQRCDHVVGLMGAEPISAALQQGADVVIACRAADTALIAALPLMRGCPSGPTWHAAKIAECGGCAPPTRAVVACSSPSTRPDSLSSRSIRAPRDTPFRRGAHVVPRKGGAPTLRACS